MTCPVCGAADLRPKRVLHDLRVAVCSDCTLRIAEHDGERTRSSYARIDHERYRNSIGRVRAMQAIEIVDRARRYVAGGTWLDAGAGFGYAIDAARSGGFDAHGVEPDTLAAKTSGVTHGTLRDAPVASADVISTLDVLEHVPDLAAFAADVRAILRGGGVWIVKVPTSEGVLFRVAHLVRARAFLRRLWQCDERHPHLFYFNGRSLRRFFESQSFEVLEELPLEEVPPDTIVDRLTVHNAMPRWRARLAAPFIRALHAIGKSDALLMIARRVRQ